MSVRLAGPALGHLTRVWRSRKVRRRAARDARAAPGEREAGRATLAAGTASSSEISAVAGPALRPALLAGQRKDGLS